MQDFSPNIDEIFITKDLWTYLQSTNKKIVLYGMGDGADKIINVCNQKGITVSGVFASDGFASGKLFRGHKVITYSETKQNLNDFIVLVSFATQRQEVLNNIYKISTEKETYCPDVPVFGSGLFDSEFVKNNEQKIRLIHSILCDEQSKNTYLCLILAKLTGNIEYLKACQTDVSEAYYNIIQPSNNAHYVDIGAYNGDTIKEYLSFASGASTITAFEPDAKNFAKLIKCAKENGIDTTHFHNIAAWDQKQTLTFYSRSGRNSAATSNHAASKHICINADKADDYIETKADYIKIDAEGSDKQVLEGLKNTIMRDKPCVCCALYHRNEDMFEIPLMLYKMYEGACQMYVRHFPYVPAWDTNIYIKYI